MKLHSKSIFNIFTLFALLISLTGSAVNVTPARALTHTVTDCTKDNGGAGQLRTLMNAAVSGDTINIPACTITIEGAAGENANASGDLDITKNLTINGAGAGSTIIDGAAIDRVFEVVLGGFTVNISGVTIRNGNVSPLGGGGILNGGALTVTNSTFSGNSAVNGGGIYNDAGTLTVSNSTFSGNNGVLRGGAIYNNNGGLTISTSTFSNNTSLASGGGIYTTGPTLTISHSTFSGNKSTSSQGGAIVSIEGTLTVSHSTFTGNTAGSAAAILAGSTTGIITISNSTFSSNSSGAIYADGTINIYNSTFSGHSDTFRSLFGGSVITIKNSLFVNSPSGNHCHTEGTFTIGTDSMADDASCGSATQKTSAQINLGSLTGSPAYLPLGAGSTAIDAGDNATCAAAPVNNTSQNGVTRPANGDSVPGSVCDIGSYEAPIAGYTVTFNSNGGAGVMAAQFAGVATPLTSNSFIRTGYTFTSWNSAPNSSGTAYANNASYPFTSSITLYAQWIIDVVHTPIFTDVPFTHWANSYIERLYKYGVTSGCGTSPMIYCPDGKATRAEMAIFILRTKYNTPFVSYNPPTATGKVFTDVPLGAFADAWIEQLAKEGITNGCGGGNYCPSAPITRAEMAIFLLRGKYGSAYNPPAATGLVFTDVSAASFAAAWIEQLAKEGITTGCGAGKFCPGNPVTRAEMAVFLVKAFGLP